MIFFGIEYARLKVFSIFIDRCSLRLQIVDLKGQYSSGTK